MRVETKYSLGQEVFEVKTREERVQIICGTCGGTGRARIAVSDQTVTCPNCRGGKNPGVAQWVEYWIQPLTIGQVRFEVSEHETREQYMCLETGVGSGQLYNVERLHATEAKARAHANEKGLCPDRYSPEGALRWL